MAVSSHFSAMARIVPPPLRPGETIAIIPTARAITMEELRPAITLAESWGLLVRIGKGIGRKHFQQAGTDLERAEDLQAAIDDPEVRAIWCARGGYGTVRLIDRIDLRKLTKVPKWIVGFSDITVLHNALHKLGIAALHAQMPFNIAPKSNGTKETLKAALMERIYRIEIPATNSFAHNTGEAEAEIIGGNLSLLYALRGTPYDIDPAGKILFLEDLDELLYHMDRMVQNLRLSGWFKGLAGLIIGGMNDMRNKNENDPFGMSVEEIIADAIGEVKYPVCYGFPAGHIDDNRALIFGQKARLKVDPDRITLEFGSAPA
jgi:muramoyltetrapeptide carboxypeptidase